jgi:hypothetical protein
MISRRWLQMAISRGLASNLRDIVIIPSLLGGYRHVPGCHRNRRQALCFYGVFRLWRSRELREKLLDRCMAIPYAAAGKSRWGPLYNANFPKNCSRFWVILSHPRALSSRDEQKAVERSPQGSHVPPQKSPLQGEIVCLITPSTTLPF